MDISNFTNLGLEAQGAGNLLIGISMVGQLFVSVYAILMARRNAHQIKHLEINTNSIKDALVKVTGEAEHAKGVLQGLAERVTNGKDTKN